RAQVLIGFSESAEHIALTAASWLGGIRYDGYVGAQAGDASFRAFDDGFVDADWSDTIVFVDDDGGFDAISTSVVKMPVETVAQPVFDFVDMSADVQSAGHHHTDWM
ncbi:MAG: hypothetical protein KJ824_11045, partial [Alphaproteobacteria bacterium]|nr:hypothetical protein [Alphaproteobacteria bacterium]